MALDELKENDDVYEIDDFKYIVDKKSSEGSEISQIDFRIITSRLPPDSVFPRDATVAVPVVKNLRN